MLDEMETTTGCQVPNAELGAAEYHARPELSRTGLERFMRSPWHYQQWLAAPQEDTQALVTGIAAHVLILERATFADRYARGPAGDARTKAYKESMAACLAHAEGSGRTVLDGDDFDSIVAMQSGVWEHPAARGILSRVSELESSFFWTETFEADEVKCRARIDGVCGNIVIDLKTTADASPEWFGRSSWKFGYHRQAAMYRRAMLTCGREWAGHVIVAVESKPPHGVAVYSVGSALVYRGDKEIVSAMRRFAELQSTPPAEWPGYSNEILELSAPAWAEREL